MAGFRLEVGGGAEHLDSVAWIGWLPKHYAKRPKIVTAEKAWISRPFL
jgi:hypothetical protein